MLQEKTVVLGVTGSIAAYKIASLASKLVKLHADVHVLMTQNATNFITPITFETLTGNKCLIDTFDRNFQYNVEHVALAKRADLVMIAPASANIIAKMAHGIADDMLSTTVLACRCKKLVAPAMNTNMFENPIVQDNLETLRSTLEDCTLTATMDGTITALNATVGSVCSGTVATIQNTDALVVDVTIPANSVPKLSTGMTCHITSDATGDAVIDGTLTQIDPVANDTGSFGAKVVVNGDADGLLIGISAKVEIVISEKDNVFIVPRDAVGTADDGSSYVLRKTGGEGVDMTFEQVTVTTGDTNDFYVEITGSDLQEGDVIRSSADLTQGIETSSDSTLPDGVQQMENGDLYVGDPSNMPEGTVVMGGGDAPAGGPDGGPGGGQ